MKCISITFDDTTLKIEHDRSLKDITEEDVYWCFRAEITLYDGISELYIETPLFYFTNQLFELFSLLPPVEQAITDYYDSYRLQVTYQEMGIIISDEYSGSKVTLTCKQLFQEYAEAFQEAVETLISNNQSLHECDNFNNVVRTLSERLNSLS